MFLTFFLSHILETHLGHILGMFREHACWSFALFSNNHKLTKIVYKDLNLKLKKVRKSYYLKKLYILKFISIAFEFKFCRSIVETIDETIFKLQSWISSYRVKHQFLRKELINIFRFSCMMPETISIFLAT